MLFKKSAKEKSSAVNLGDNDKIIYEWWLQLKTKVTLELLRCRILGILYFLTEDVSQNFAPS